MDDTLLHSTVDLADPDPNLVARATAIAQEPSSAGGIDNDYGKDWMNRSVTKGRKTYVSAFNQAVDLGPDALEWARQTVGISSSAIRVNFTQPGRSLSGPHTDRSRDWVLIYLLQAGGPDHVTVFYRELGHPLIRPRHTAVNHYGSLTVLSRLQVPLRRWTLMNTRVLHSIENISQGRYAIQVSVQDHTALTLQDAVWA